MISCTKYLGYEQSFAPFSLELRKPSRYGLVDRPNLITQPRQVPNLTHSEAGAYADTHNSRVERPLHLIFITAMKRYC